MGHLPRGSHRALVFRELLAHISLELPIYTRAVFLSRFGLVSQSSSAIPLLLLRAGPADFLNGRIPAVPAAAAALPSVEVSWGYIEPEFAGAEASIGQRIQSSFRTRSAKPNDVLVKMPSGAARLGRGVPHRPDRAHGSSY